MDKPTITPKQLYAIAIVFESFLATSPRARCQDRNEPGILLNGVNVAGTTTGLSVGQVITLTAEPNNGDGGIGWENLGQVMGNPLTDFSFPHCEPMRTSKCSSKLTYVDYSTHAITLFWYFPGTYEMGWLYETKNGEEKTLVATFNVSGPSANDIKATLGSITSYDKAIPGGTYPVMGLGQADVHSGILFKASPSAYLSGTIEWLQLLGSYDLQYINSSGTRTEPSLYGLDTSDHNSPFYSSKIRTDDNPDVFLCSDADTVKVFQKFEMYLLWKSNDTNSIFVPVGHVTWSWGATAYNEGSNNWLVSPSSGQPIATVGANNGNLLNDLPYWDTFAKPLTLEESCPNG